MISGKGKKMNYTDNELTGFFDAVESLKKYRRADLIDNSGRDLLKELYTDLLPNDYILKKSLKENTTFLIGRKGTGKSTIFLRLEQELRSIKGYLPCYLDVKTLYESSQVSVGSNKTLENLFDKETLDKYLIERSFIQIILVKIVDEVTKKFNSNTNKLLKAIGFSKVEEVKEKLAELKINIKDNQYLEDIELPLLQTIVSSKTTSISKEKEKILNTPDFELSTGVSSEGSLSGAIKVNGGNKNTSIDAEMEEREDIFSSVFIKVFQVREIILGIKELQQ